MFSFHLEIKQNSQSLGEGKDVVAEKNIKSRSPPERRTNRQKKN